MSPSLLMATRTLPDENGDNAVPAATPAAHSALYWSGSTVVTVKCADPSQLTVCDNPDSLTRTDVSPSRRTNPLPSGAENVNRKLSSAMLNAIAAVPGSGS